MSHKAYRQAAWRKLRLIKLDNDPLCEKCGKPAEEVDHKIPVANGGSMYDYDNLQSMCKTCHSKKTNEEKRCKPSGKILTRYDLPGGSAKKKRNSL